MPPNLEASEKETTQLHEVVWVRLKRLLVWLLLFGIFLRYASIWASALTGASLPGLGSAGFTVLFAAFSILHASDMLGWRRALLFLLVCVAVSWGFESVGVATGAVYGNYHYGDALGAKIAGVPLIIPFAWFMMVYASWIVAHILLEGAGTPSSIGGALARAFVASTAMTAWDAVMDPGKARSGAWIWEKGGPYFGVPFQNFVGWIATTVAIYLIVAVAFRFVPRRQIHSNTRFYTGLPVLAYALVAFDHLLIETIPELHIVAAFGICLVALLAILRLILVRDAIALPD
ncbi:carotenoid biosynthesis protein [Paraburkholderia solisilvae]|uniref:Carotenoid biosynthesis protein n=1 Tax=Paraburkholderia solisilvae TaxID=624376 RepID=A0A6J5DBL9_9BURK|nr:carotenoid biosynthesis protein [Paraburkholderia solisilvae]CAB3751689.1 hypothetical protein LMG29739_01358 [Paraburkholderia solisilvae]